MRGRRPLAAAIAIAATFTIAAAGTAGATTKPFPKRPFARTSIWNRRVAPTATFTDVQTAVFGDPDWAPTSIGIDVVTMCSTDAGAPLTNVERGSGWTYPARATSSGTVLYQRHLAAGACTDLTISPISNGLWVLYDPLTGLADLGVGGWRDPGGPLLNSAGDGSGAHNVDVRAGTGLVGYGRASGLPALGGAIRLGELKHGINHAVSINVPITRMSSTQHFVWPASSADGSAPSTYQGPTPDYTMGTLLAIPRSIPFGTLTWHTPEGRRLALSARNFGWYIVDAVAAPQVQLAVETTAARTDLGAYGTGSGLAFDGVAADVEGIQADVLQILHLLRAVTPNPHP